MRLDKILSELKYGSRNEIKKAVKAHRIKVNDTIAKTASMHVDPTKDSIIFDDEVVTYIERLVLMMNKPAGYLSATHDKTDAVVIDLLNEPFNRYDLSIAGRLDKDAEGLLILTNDGQLVHTIINPNNTVYKRYEVHTELPIDNIEDLLKPMELLDGNNALYSPLKPRILSVSKNIAIIEICEGKFHQVKRMFAHINHQVTYLKRVQISDLELDKTLNPGEVKVLTQTDLDKLIKKG